jgi:predicted SAM-dependent methyltransferase
MKLNIGCGPHYAEGWMNMELTDATEYHADIRGDVRYLASAGFLDGSVERIYMGHIIEHLPLGDVLKALAECHRVLTDDGVMMVIGPDAELCRSTSDYETVLALDHQGGREGGPHLWVPTGKLVDVLLQRAGFESRDVDIQWVTNDWPVVSRIHWQFAREARKA